MPSITVAITTYNLEAYIENCVEELMRQTLQDFEVLIYDDCSTDRTRELLEGLRKKYPAYIRLLLGETALKSPARARNAILNSGAITGQYIVFLDGDDSIEDCFLEELYAAAQRSGAEITLCSYDRVEEETGHILCREMQGFPQEICFPPNDDIAVFINGSLWNKMILVECIGSVRLPDFRVGEDLSFQLALYDKCHKIACVDQVLIHYRVRTSSVITNTQEETVYQFAQELLRLWTGTSQEWLRSSLEMIAFIHIGISMPLRVHENPEVGIKQLFQWINDYFKENYQWFRGNPMFHLLSLARHGVKGIGLWAAKVCYRLHCFTLFLWAYCWITKALHIELKF